MDWNVFRRLGERVAADFDRANHDERRLPAIAASALEAAELPPMDFGGITRFLCETDIVQDPGNRFSDLPLIVYRAQDFYVQLLVWNESTTTIHQHAFSGAFRVLQGSSVHTCYDFEEKRHIGSRLLLGEVRVADVECLRAGDVREIQPGQGGLLHALYHLEHPSATVVVRTPRLLWATPQYSIARPCFAVDEPALRKDSQVAILRRALRAARAADPKAVAEMLHAQIATLDFPRLFMLREDLDAVLPDADDQDAFIAAVRVRHGDLADRLREALEWTRVERSLLQARNFTRDAELRFFIALLLNVPDREWFFRVVRQRFPKSDPAELCAEWITRLTSAEALLDAVARNDAARRSTKRSAGLVQRLTGLLPKSSESRKSVLAQLLTGKGGGDCETAALGLRRIPELSPLFLKATVRHSTRTSESRRAGLA